MLVGKQLELLKATLPTVSRVGIIRSARNLADSWGDLAGAGQELGVAVEFLDLEDAESVHTMLEAGVRAGIEGLLALPAAEAYLGHIVDFARQARRPLATAHRHWVEAGALLSYGDNRVGRIRRAVYYVDRILQGTPPADLPVEQPMMFELVVNMKTARELGITFPHEVALQITEVVE